MKKGPQIAPEPTGDIHYFDGTILDEDGDCLFGYYFEISSDEMSSSGLIGPYSTGPEAETACQLEYDSLCQK